jgi:glycogen synthase
MSAERADGHAADRTGCRAGCRGRVVMLVDNGVDGDSRVQKTARSAAAAGWDVVLLGRAPGKKRVTWRLGGAEVWLIPVPTPLGRRRYEGRRAPLRNPLAYPPGPHAAYRKQRVKAWRTDLYHRHLALGLPAGRGAGAGAGRARGARHALALICQAALFVLRGYVRALGGWVAMRARQTDALKRKRAAMDAPVDRFTTWFWRRAMGGRCWRRFDPHLWDWELAYGRVVDELAPDLIHAHDFRMLGVGARAALRARAQGRAVKLVWDVHEFLPGIKPWSDNPRWHPAQCAYEREYAPHADAVVTVSERLADLLAAEHGLPERPAVVLNAPEPARLHDDGAGDGHAADLRGWCGIGPRVPLVVYSGSASQARGLDIMIEALPRLEEVHVALVVARPTAPYVLELAARAAELGAGDRVHILPYVPYDQVVALLSAADAGVIPIHHWPNHEIALITKFFEYSHARLPIVVSDVETMAEVTRSTGQGEVFTAEDVDDYVRAVRAVLAAPERYRAAYDAPGLLARWTWAAQAEILDRVYHGLRPDLPEAPPVCPDVSVIVAVYDSMPYLGACLTSLVEQSIGLARMEIIAVNDGSTDGGGKELDRFAESYPGVVRVIHQTNSGGPAGPYNRALDAATGRYVYFVGSDDHLGAEALERLVNAADEWGSDVVAGKMVGVGGRRIHQALYQASDPDVDLYDSALPWTLNNCKLFRRDLIERHGVRYPEDMPAGSDQQFTFEACRHANRISVLAEYDYYYAVRREDAGNLTYRTTCVGRLDCAEKLIEFKAAHTEPGPRRDKILRVHFRWELASLLQQDFLGLDRDTQEHVCARIARLADRHLTPAIRDGLDSGRRTRLCLAQRGEVDPLCEVIRQDAAGVDPPVVLAADGAFAGYPGFRDDRGDIPDDCYRITADLASRIAGGIGTSSVRWDRDGTGGPVLSIAARAALTGPGALDPGVVRVVMVPPAGGGRALEPVAQVTREPAADGGGTEIRAVIPVDSLVAAHRASAGGGAGSRRLAVRLHVTVAGVTYEAPLAAGGPIAEVRHWRRGRRYTFRPMWGAHGPLVIAVPSIPPLRSVIYRLRRQPIK